MTLIVAAVSGGIGAIASYAVTKTKVEFLQGEVKDLKASVIYKDNCNSCKENWQGKVDNIKDDIGEIKDNIKEILMRLPK